MTNSIASTKNYTTILDEVYQSASVSGCLTSGRKMVRAGRNAKEILIPKIEVSGLGDYTRNVGYKTGSINYAFETKTFNYDRGIRLMADVMDVEEAGVLDCFVEAGAELQRTQVAPEADAFTFAQIAGHTGVELESESYASATAETLLERLREVTSGMDTDNDIAPCRALRIKSLNSARMAPGTDDDPAHGLSANCLTFSRSVSPAPGAGGHASDLIGARLAPHTQPGLHGSTVPSVSCPAWPSAPNKRTRNRRRG